MKFKIGSLHGRYAGHTSKDGFLTVMIITTFPLVERPCARCPTQDPPDHSIAFSYSLFELNITQYVLKGERGFTTGYRGPLYPAASTLQSSSSSSVLPTSYQPILHFASAMHFLICFSLSSPLPPSPPPPLPASIFGIVSHFRSDHKLGGVNLRGRDSTAECWHCFFFCRSAGPRTILRAVVAFEFRFERLGVQGERQSYRTLL